MKVLSLGGGVQSTTVLLMSLAGELPALDAVIFADPGWEGAAVYQHVGGLELRCEEAGVPFYWLDTGNIREDALNPHKRFASMPLHVLSEKGKPAIIRRQCTSDYKIAPIQSKIREILGGNTRGKQVEQWIGISVDEATRMRDSRVKYIRLAYPLIDAGMSRHDCLLWLSRRNEAIPPKSSCIGCPYHDNAYWRNLRDNSPKEWQEAVDFDTSIRNGNVRFGKAGLHGKAFLHRSLRPLCEVDLSVAADHGQIEMFGEECEGVCGV